MPLTTRCRHCGRMFPVYAQQLRAHRSLVTCPQCGRRFRALAGLLDEPTLDTDAASARAAAGRRPGRARRVQVASEGEPPASAPPRLPLALLLVLALTLLLGLQLFAWGAALRDGVPSGPLAGPLAGPLTGLCETLDGLLHRRRSPVEAFRVDEPALVTDPGGASMSLRLELVNQSPRAASLPFIELELFDRYGELTAARRFAPSAYLGPGEAASGAVPERLDAGASLPVELQLVRQRPQPSGFRVRLR